MDPHWFPTCGNINLQIIYDIDTYKKLDILAWAQKIEPETDFLCFVHGKIP